MKFIGEFNTFDNSQSYQVQIGNPDSIYQIDIIDPTESAMTDPFAPDLKVMFDTDPVTITADRQDLKKRIIIAQAIINLVSNEDLTEELFADTDREIPVSITRWNQTEHSYSDECFFGYVDPLQFSQGYAHNWESIQITATDPLGALENLNVGDLTGITSTSSVTPSNLIEAILGAAGITTITTDIEARVQDAMDNTNIKMSLFFGESEDDWYNLYDLLEEICKYFSLYVTYYDGGAYIMSTINFQPTQINISNFKNAASDASTNISVDTAYSQATVKCEIEPKEDIVISLNDNDYLYSDYTNYEPYMTEFISPGEGDRAFSGFYSMVTDPEYHSIWEEAYTIDNFVYVKKNAAWDFGPQGYTTLHDGTYEDHYTDQKDYLTWLKNNTGRGALIAFGRSPKLNKKDNSPLANITMTDYLVIAVNGMYNKSYAAGQQQYNTIRNVQPVCSFTGLTDAILSPSDPLITNYIVISGKLLLNPLQRLSGKPWSNEAYNVNKLPNNDNTVAKWIYYYNQPWPTSSLYLQYHTVPHPDNGDGAYYNQIWETGINGVHGYLDNSANQDFEYKYNVAGEDADDVEDEISKIPILACELKVGNKYCVERLDLGQDGVGKFEWLTTEQCTTLGITDKYFTIGIDPKPGDKIIGQTFDIQNNVNYHMNLEATGTAIPIKSSDNLAGEISFKILGPYNIVWKNITKRTHSKWLFWTSTHWGDDDVNLLQYIQSIMISNLKIETKSDNGMISSAMTSADNDLVYSSDMNPVYIEKFEDDIKICTPLTLQESVDWGIKYQISDSYIYKTNNEPFFGYDDGEDGYIKPEDCLVDYYYNEYCEPARMISTSVWTTTFGTGGLNGAQMNEVMLNDYVTGMYYGYNGIFRVMNYETSLKHKTMAVDFREYKTYNHTQLPAQD